MSLAIRLSEYHGLSPAEKQGRVQSLLDARSRPLNGELAQLNEAIAGFETRYEMPSETMRERLNSGELGHTADVCRWQILLDLRNRVKAS